MARYTRILILADDQSDGSAMRQALEQYRFAVETASNTTTAYQHLLDAKIDLVVVDVSGPMLEPGDFVKRIRATPQLTGILILIIAEWGTGGATLALSQGADAYEPKPLDANRLITSIERLLRKEAAAAGQTP